MLKKQKVHLLLHLVECMEYFGPTSAFNSERCGFNIIIGKIIIIILCMPSHTIDLKLSTPSSEHRIYMGTSMHLAGTSLTSLPQLNKLGTSVRKVIFPVTKGDSLVDFINLYNVIIMYMYIILLCEYV